MSSATCIQQTVVAVETHAMNEPKTCAANLENKFVSRQTQLATKVFPRKCSTCAESGFLFSACCWDWEPPTDCVHVVQRTNISHQMIRQPFWRPSYFPRMHCHCMMATRRSIVYSFLMHAHCNSNMFNNKRMRLGGVHFISPNAEAPLCALKPSLQIASHMCVWEYKWFVRMCCCECRLCSMGIYGYL